MKRAAFERLALRRVRRLTAGYADHEHPVWSPDGRWLAFSAGPYGQADLYLVDRRGRFARRLTGGPGMKTQPAWSPDGARIAYRHQRAWDAPSEIRVLLVAGEHPPETLLSGGGASMCQPAWSPDGARLAYFSDEGSPGNFHLALYDLERRAREPLTGERDRNDCHPAWSPDGRRLAFHAYEGLEADHASIHVLDVKTKKAERVSSGPGISKHPAFAGNGLVLFHREHADREPSLIALDLASGRERRLGAGKHAAAVVTPRGRIRVAFAAHDPEREDDQGRVWPTFDIYRAELAQA